MFSTRTHVKALLFPALVLIVVVALGAYVAAMPGDDNKHQGQIRIAVAVVAGVLILWQTRSRLTMDFAFRTAYGDAREVALYSGLTFNKHVPHGPKP